MNRYGKIHKGHCKPWLTQHISELCVQLGLPAIYNEPDVHNHAVHLDSWGGGSYGISTLPQPLMNLYNIKPASNSITSTRQKSRHLI